MVEGETKLADATILVKDGEVFVFFDGDTGSSEPLTEDAVKRLEFIAGLSRIILEETT